MKQQDAAILAHSYRTVVYAHAIANIDGLEIDATDQSLLWCACMLHDVGLDADKTDRCFAVRGGEMAYGAASAAGIDPNEANLLGDAICRHLTPGLNKRRNPIPYLVSTAALVDVLGSRLEQMDPKHVGDLLREKAAPRICPRTGGFLAYRSPKLPRGTSRLARRAGFAFFAQRPLCGALRRSIAI